MNVYGFPSKLAALQFEWAWQHPTSSRHLRNVVGKVGDSFPTSNSSSNLLKTKVAVVRTMLSVPPWNTWPLRVKLYSKEVARLWEKLVDSSQSLPKGVEVSSEMEGVDGKNGLVGSGRTGPIDVTDREFTTEHLEKSKLLASSRATNEKFRIKSDFDPEIFFTVGSSSSYIVHSRELHVRISFKLHCTKIPSSLRTPCNTSLPSTSSSKQEFITAQGCHEKKAGAVNAVAKEAQELSEKESSGSEGSADEEGGGGLETALHNLHLGDNQDATTSPPVATKKRGASKPRKKPNNPVNSPPQRPPKPPQPVQPAEAPKKRGRPRKVPSVAKGTRSMHSVSHRGQESSDESDTSLEMIDIEGIYGSD
ncbi:Slx4p interacting protein [Tulasnella sp. 424]|nr:Slx4p interacting protein [Tulasnella sp. 424]KAG8966314.1 Slx4p interacting protein [Tulasnella sp. 425]